MNEHDDGDCNSLKFQYTLTLTIFRNAFGIRWLAYFKFPTDDDGETGPKIVCFPTQNVQ